MADKAEVSVKGHINVKVLGAFKQLLAFQFSGTLILVIGTSAVLWHAYSQNSEKVTLLPLVMLAGMLGAFFSALTRLYRVDEAGLALISPTVQSLGGLYLFMYSFVPPLIGAISAVVLYLVFGGKIITGGVFPDLSCPTEDMCKSMKGLMDNLSPAHPQDYCRALVWGFIAGFSERFVPNLLQSLVAKQEKEEKDVK